MIKTYMCTIKILENKILSEFFIVEWWSMVNLVIQKWLSYCEEFWERHFLQHFFFLILNVEHFLQLLKLRFYVKLWLSDVSWQEEIYSLVFFNPIYFAHVDRSFPSNRVLFLHFFNTNTGHIFCCLSTASYTRV